jgi:hypothetical protein
MVIALTVGLLAAACGLSAALYTLIEWWAGRRT